MAVVFLIIALIIAILAVIFALQNAGVVSVVFFTSNLEGSLALILLITFAVGVIAGIFLILPYLIRKSLKIRRLTRKLQESERQINKEEEEFDDGPEFDEV